MSKQICCIFNSAPHYRIPVYSMMDTELDCDFYFGDWLANSIKQLDFNSLNGFKKICPINQIPLTGFEWQTGVWQLIFKPYKHYIITGTPGSLSNWLLACLAKITGKKIYAWTHGMKGNTSTMGKLIEKMFYRLCHRILLYGNHAKQNMIAEGFSSEKLVVIYNSLDHQKQLEIRKNLKKTDIFNNHFNNDNPVIIHTGRIQKSKKIDQLIQVVANLNAADIPCNLVLVGPNADSEGLETLPVDLKISKNVWFYGPCYDEAIIAELFYNSDVCVSPGPIGLTALHSMTYGCPVITNDNFSGHGPEYEALAPGISGDFFMNNDIADLGKKILNWINRNKSDRAKTSVKCHEIVDAKYNAKNQLKILKAALSQ